MGLNVAEQMQNATARPHVDRFLIVTHATFPLSAAVLEGARAHWTSTSGQVAAWLWPQGPPRRAEGGLKLQVGGQGPVRDRFVDIDIDGTGQGTVRQDEFGLAPLYVATRDAFSFVSNRPDLIALAQHGVLGRWPERDRAFSALLAFKGLPMGDRTGYAEVRCVPFLAHVQVAGANARLVDPPSPPWAPSRPASDLARAVDELETSAAAQLRQVVDCTTRDGGRPRLELTGGRDSRLVLALAIRSGTIDGFDVVTYTGDAQDPRVARQVARCANAKHLIEYRPPVADSPFERVRTTSGALNLSESHRANPGSALATVMSGLVGETLSSNYPSTAPLKTRGQVLRAFIEQPNLDLLTEPAWVEAVVETMQLLLAPLAQGADTEDLLDAFYVQHRVRRWISVRPEAFSATAFPLYCPTAVRFAFALGWQGRVEHRIHDAIIERAGGRHCPNSLRQRQARGRAIAGNDRVSGRRSAAPRRGVAEANRACLEGQETVLAASRRRQRPRPKTRRSDARGSPRRAGQAGPLSRHRQCRRVEPGIRGDRQAAVALGSAGAAVAPAASCEAGACRDGIGDLARTHGRGRVRLNERAQCSSPRRRVRSCPAGRP